MSEAENVKVAVRVRPFISFFMNYDKFFKSFFLNNFFKSRKLTLIQDVFTIRERELEMPLWWLK